ncbi:DeoR/GlpR family DNA-binding transcription regulator [Rhodoferax sp. WC2427]|uniref:DeoR/GlpR family DNA-binding transcription regulator n=1 Tax=Rhodoferax sp. WC2427 TaxID=3234144 RepID=UPI003466AD94
MTSPQPLAIVTLLPSQRRDRIVDFLRRHGAVTLQQLAQALDASVSTLRRDLDVLEADGVLDRTHGGALLRQQHYSTFEPDPVAAAELSPREKRAIGYAAAAELQPGQSVVFDSGSTVMEVARAVLERRIPLVAVTNDLAIAQLLGSSPQIRVHVLGGMLRAGSNTLMGDEVLTGARHIRADVLLMGAHAVTDGVLSETDPEVAAVKRALMQAAHTKRLLVDASKFRPRAFMTICTLAEFDAVITDSGIPAAELDALGKAGLQVTQVSVA